MDKHFKPKLSPDEFGWYERRGLPHLDAEQFCQFITFRLYDSMPQEVVERWRNEAESDVAFRKRVEAYLDSSYGQSWMRRPDVALIVEFSLLFHHGKKCDVHAWVVMPNHVHVLMTLYAGVHLPVLMKSVKSFSASEINKLLGRTGQVWQHGSFDRYIRNRRHYVATLRYIEENPVKAGLCSTAAEWPFSSASRRNPG